MHIRNKVRVPYCNSVTSIPFETTISMKFYSRGAACVLLCLVCFTGTIIWDQTWRVRNTLGTQFFRILARVIFTAVVQKVSWVNSFDGKTGKGVVNSYGTEKLKKNEPVALLHGALLQTFGEFPTSGKRGHASTDSTNLSSQSCIWVTSCFMASST